MAPETIEFLMAGLLWAGRVSLVPTQADAEQSWKRLTGMVKGASDKGR